MTSSSQLITSIEWLTNFQEHARAHIINSDTQSPYLVEKPPNSLHNEMFILNRKMKKKSKEEAVSNIFDSLPQTLVKISNDENKFIIDNSCQAMKPIDVPQFNRVFRKFEEINGKQKEIYLSENSLKKLEKCITSSIISLLSTQIQDYCS